MTPRVSSFQTEVLWTLTWVVKVMFCTVFLLCAGACRAYSENILPFMLVNHLQSSGWKVTDKALVLLTDWSTVRLRSDLFQGIPFSPLSLAKCDELLLIYGELFQSFAEGHSSWLRCEVTPAGCWVSMLHSEGPWGMARTIFCPPSANQNLSQHLAPWWQQPPNTAHL